MPAPEYFAFLASAVAGYTVSVHRAAVGHGRAFSDGRDIMVQDDTPWLAVVAQASLLGGRALDASLLRRLIGKRQAADRYLYLEVLRTAALLRDRLPLAFTARAEIAAPLTGSAQASLDLALGDQRLPALPEWFGTIRPLSALRRAVGEEGFAALTRQELPAEPKRRDVDELDEGDSSEESAILKLFSNPLLKGNPLSALVNDLLGAGVSARDPTAPSGDGGAELPVGRIQHGLRRLAGAIVAHLPVPFPEIELVDQIGAWSYPEWDVHAQHYRRDWVSVEEVEPWAKEGPHDTGGDFGSPSIALRRQLASLGLDHEVHRRQSDGADLDTPALIDVAIDLRSGHSPPALNIYRSSRQTRRDLAVAIALDISGSTADGGGTAAIFHKQCQIGYQLARALDLLGDHVAMFGFHSWGRKRVVTVCLKGAREAWSGAIAERMAMLEPVGYTRIGAVIRHGARMLQHDMRLPHRLLILITDGIAYDQDYEHRYAESDTRKALEEARAAGTACLCLNVGGSGEADKLADLFGAANILAVDDVEDITPSIRAMCRRSLAAVGRRSLESPPRPAR